MDLNLSKHDQNILKIILNGEESLTANAYIVDPELDPDQHIETSIVSKLVEQEKSAIKLFDQQKINEAVSLLDAIIEQHPLYASAYNNRAQVRRSTNMVDQRAIDDLQRALKLATPSSRYLSKMQATVMKNAYAQLAAIYMQQAKETTNEQQMWDYNEKASVMLQNAGTFGDKIMTALATKINPFAKLCGGMVEQALKAERSAT